MTIREQLESARQMLGHSLVVPTPPACNALLQRARAEGIAVGQLFVVSRRLHPGLRGRYERSSGDLWCHYGAQEPDGKRLLLQSLLVLLAHLKLHQPVPT